MEKNPYEKNKYLEKHQYLNVSQAELERKWRLYEEEQELMKLMMGASAPGNASAVPFISTWKTDNTSTGSSNSNQVRLPLMPNGSYNFYVNWGDGTVSSIASWNQPEATHTYAAVGTYTITITGYINGWSFAAVPPLTGATGDRLKLLTISQWGCLRFNSIVTDPTINAGAFYNCTNLTLLTVSDTPNFAGSTSLFNFFRSCTALTTINNVNKWDVSGITYFRSTFRDCIYFNDNVGNWNTSNGTNMGTMFFGSNTVAPFGLFTNGGSDSIKNWDVSKVTDVNAMFSNQPSFNYNLGSWNVGNVTNMGFMFGGNTGVLGTFDNAGSDDINNWDVSKVTTMASMFQNQPSFNRNIGNWNTSNVTNFSFMFTASSLYVGIFNKNISNWNTSSATLMNSMFYNQRSFNQNVGSWNTSNVTNMSYMFVGDGGKGSFNNGGSNTIKNWNTGKVTDMSYMFYNQSDFNQEIGTWDVSKVTNMLYTLGGNYYSASAVAGVFNNGGSDSIKNWNTGAVTNMSSMFSYQKDFNQPIGNWDLSKVTNISQMFRSLVVGVSAFNQPIGNWNISAVTNAATFMENKTFNDYSTANYDALLIGWASRPVKPNLSINFGTIKRTAAATAARAVLTGAPNNWTIVDGGI